MGKSLGILMLDTVFPRIVGDVGNELSYTFPIVKKVIVGADPAAVVLNADPSLLGPFIEGARELESLGVSAITTSCGFLAMFQKELAAAVNIPLFTSALLLYPTLAGMLPVNKRVGIITANSDSLSTKHFEGVGVQKLPRIIYGMQGTQFGSVFVGNRQTLDKKLAEAEMVSVAKKMTKEHPEVGAILFECTNMPPYARAVEDATGKKVYHILSLAECVLHTID